MNIRAMASRAQVMAGGVHQFLRHWLLYFSGFLSPHTRSRKQALPQAAALSNA
jgi:hypothetical protein